MKKALWNNSKFEILILFLEHIVQMQIYWLLIFQSSSKFDFYKIDETCEFHLWANYPTFEVVLFHLCCLKSDIFHFMTIHKQRVSVRLLGVSGIFFHRLQIIDETRCHKPCQLSCNL